MKENDRVLVIVERDLEELNGTHIFVRCSKNRGIVGFGTLVGIGVNILIMKEYFVHLQILLYVYL